MINRRNRSIVDRIALLIMVFGLAACTSSGGLSTGAGTAAGLTPRPPFPRSQPSSDWPGYHNTPDRAGLGRMPATTAALSIAARLTLDGAVYASPIVVGEFTIIATENNTVYAYDSTYHLVWKRHLGPPSPQRERPCGNIDPLGITGTPVYDPVNRLVYVAAELSGNPPTHELYALTPRTGNVQFQHSLDLPGVQQNAMQQRGALALTAGRVYVPFGGLDGDCGGYKGRIVAWNADGTGQAISYTVPTKREAGIWATPGPVVDLAGRLLVAVGNGAAVQGDPYDYSDSILALSPDLRLLDSFSPSSWASDNAQDLDLGSQGPTIVNSQWIFTAGKSGTAYVLRRDHLGGIGGQVSSLDVCRSFGGTAVSYSVAFVPCTDGLRAVRVGADGTMRVIWHADSGITGSPVVGAGLVWSLDTRAGVLHALDPATGHSTASIKVGSVTRFATPAIASSDLLVPTTTGVTVVRTAPAPPAPSTPAG